MKKSLVITTINKPRSEIVKFSKLSEWDVICVGDKKTPSNWKIENVKYIAPPEQSRIFPTFSKLLPWNMYSRKNIGYLYALKNGTEIIGETDDDVFPYNNFPPNLDKNQRATILSGSKFINIYKHFGSTSSWPRGFPLELINNDNKITKKIKKIYVPIQNSVIDRDSDFDAVYRLVSNKIVEFSKKGKFAIAKGSYSPLNSQNTFFHKDAFLLLYIPSVAPHVEDILRGYIAQRILWEIGGNLLFSGTTAYTSNRNIHNYLKDFENELPLFLRTSELISILDSLSLSGDIGRSLVKVYQELVKKDLVNAHEVKIVKIWVNEVEKYL